MSDATPPLLEIEAGRQLFRVLKHEVDENGNRRYTALDPNPYFGLTWLNDLRALYPDGVAVSGRFSPFRDQQGKAVPALYLAPAKETAYYETVLRPMSTSSLRTLSRSQFDALEVATVSFESSITLADCRETYLEGGEDQFWPYSFEELFLGSQLRCIDNARGLAKHIYDTYPIIDGLVWDSVQHGNIVPVYMLFGNRRQGVIQHTVAALDDVSTWKPYLRKLTKEGTLAVAPDLSVVL